MPQLLDTLSGISTYIIGGAFAAHLMAFLVLWFWYRRDLKVIVSSLDDFTRNTRHRSVLGNSVHLSDQIEAFLADVKDILNQPQQSVDRNALVQRMYILDEKRRFTSSLFFETCYNLCRTMIEAYPLAGVLGTILAIGAALQAGATDPDATASVGLIVGRFGEAIWSTFAGLAAAIFLMFLNSMVEPPFQRLAENREHVRETVSHAKRELSLTAGETA